MGLFNFNFSPFQKTGPAVDEDFKTWANKSFKRLADALAQTVVGSGLIASATSPILYNNTTGVVSHAASGVSGPGPWGDSTHVGAFSVDVDGHVTAAASVAIAFPSSGPFTLQRTSDVANNTNSPASAGLLVPVAINDNWYVRYLLHVRNDNAPSGAVMFSLAFPAVTSFKSGLTAPTNGASTLTAAGFNTTVSPLSITPWINFATGASGIIVAIDCLFRHFTAAGNVDLQFASSSGAGNTVTISDTSTVIATKL